MSSFWTDFFYYTTNALAAIFGTIAGLLKDDKVTLKIATNKNIVVTKRHMVIVLISCIILSFVLSFKRDGLSEDKLEAKDRQHKTDDSLADINNAIREDKHKKEIVDVIFRTKESNKQDLTDNTTNILKAVKEQDKTNKQEHEKTRKTVDSNKSLTPAYVQLLRQPHNAFKIGMNGDVLTGYCMLENSGDKTAFSVSFDLHIILIIKGKNYKLPPPLPTFVKDLVGNTGRQADFELNIGASVFKNIEGFYCVVLGKFYRDENLKQDKGIDICLKYDVNSGVSNQCDFKGTTKNFLDEAILLTDIIQIPTN